MGCAGASDVRGSFGVNESHSGYDGFVSENIETTFATYSQIQISGSDREEKIG